MFGIDKIGICVFRADIHSGMGLDLKYCWFNADNIAKQRQIKKIVFSLWKYANTAVLDWKILCYHHLTNCEYSHTNACNYIVICKITCNSTSIHGCKNEIISDFEFRVLRRLQHFNLCHLVALYASLNWVIIEIDNILLPVRRMAHNDNITFKVARNDISLSFWKNFQVHPIWNSNSNSKSLLYQQPPCMKYNRGNFDNVGYITLHYTSQLGS